MPTLASSGPLSIVTLGDGRARSACRETLGWPDRGHEHIAFGAATVQERNASAARLDDAVIGSRRPVLLVAEGAACFAAAWWARLSPSDYVAKVAGALLFAPIDTDEAGMAERRSTFDSPRARLPFPTLMFARNDAGVVEPERLTALAADWGGRVAEGRDLKCEVGARTGPWRQAQRLFARYTAGVVERDIALARDRLR